MKFKALPLILIIALTINIACQKEDEAIKPISYFALNLFIYPFPHNGTINNNYSTHPYLSFNKKFDFEYYDSNNGKYYKLILDSTHIVDSDNQKVNIDYQFSYDKDTLFYNPINGFNSNTNHTIKLFYHVIARIKISEKFTLMYKDGKPFSGKFESNFTTKEYNTSIDTSIIEYAYPFPYQYHFLKNETTRGVLKFEENQDFDLYFKNASFKVKFSNLNGQNWISNAIYNEYERKLIFQIPSNNLDNQSIYRIDFTLNNGNGNDNTFLTYHIRTSKFNTFEEKISTIYDTNDTYIFIDYNNNYLIKNFKLDETIDIVEGKAFKGLIKFEAYGNESGGWINKILEFYTLFYKSSVPKDFRSTSPVKLPPLNAIFFEEDNLAQLLTQNHIIDGNAPNQQSINQELLFKIPYYYGQDFARIYTRAYNLENPNEWDKAIIESSWVGIYSNSYYRFKIYYQAGDTITSTNDWNIYIK